MENDTSKLLYETIKRKIDEFRKLIEVKQKKEEDEQSKEH